jgi:TetR/AcrR family transcriptional repressor of nem operon
VAEHDSKDASHRAVVETYLSNESRDNPGDSCPVVAFAGDMCHEAAESGLRQTYLQGLNNLLDSLGSLLDAEDEAGKRQQALVQYSLMFGALMLSRATRGDPLSDEILEAARAALTPSK